MIEPYYCDDSATLYHGDALTVAHELPRSSVDCIVTSPPYFRLRDYGIEGQYGLESSPAAYVETMRTLFAELRQVLADDGTCWVNLGDSYVSKPPGNVRGVSDRSGLHGAQTSEKYRDTLMRGTGTKRDTTGMGVAPKNLLGMPWRIAFALQDDGWILRNAIVWHKPNAMPESVADRLAQRYEMVFLFSKSRRYWFGLDMLRRPHALTTVEAASRARISYQAPGQPENMKTRTMNAVGANPGDVWEIPTQPFSAAHFAVMPLELASRCIQAGCKPAGVVLDPFSGSGTTGLAAAKHGRKYIGIDLNVEYLDLSLRTRLRQPGLDFGEVS